MQIKVNKIKVLIASIWAGSGHNSAGDMYFDLLKEDERFSVVRYISPTKYVDKSYSRMTKYIPFVFNLAIKYAPMLLSDIVTLYSYRLVHEFIELLKKEKPDLIICTHFSQFQALRIAQRILKDNTICFETFLDYGEKASIEVPYNIYLRPDYSIVYDELALNWLINKMRTNSSYIVFSGHKSKNEFKEIKNEYKNKAEIISEIKSIIKDDIYKLIDANKTTILISSGGGGTVQRIYKLLKKIANVQKNNLDLLNNYQFLVICGSNKGFFNKVYKSREKKLSWQNFYPFSWLSSKDYALLQALADYPVLYSIAPATMFELLENNCGPIIVHKLRAAHEKGNVDFVVNNKIGKYINDQDNLLMYIFSKKYIEEKKEFINRSKEIIKIEGERLSNFNDNIFNIHIDDKFKVKDRINRQYKVGNKHRILSKLLLFTLSNLYWFYRLSIFIKVVFRKIKHKFIKKI